MKILKKEIRKCEETSWEKTTVLELEYSHRKEKWRILVRDYDDSTYSYILKQLRIKVREAYKLWSLNNQRKKWTLKV